DLLSEQEAVTMRQTQLGSSLTHVQDQLASIADSGTGLAVQPVQLAVDTGIPQLELRLTELQQQIQGWMEKDRHAPLAQTVQDNESWAYLMSLLSAIQDRVGALSRDRASAQAGLQARELLE